MGQKRGRLWKKMSCTGRMTSGTTKRIQSTEVDNNQNSQALQFIPFRDSTLPSPLNKNLPWGKDPSDNKVWIYPLRG
ncbi:hypothetical protein JHK86_040263 [Glycine max]|nr:hypothetical protein JHK86_040263 [Glycine max]